ncbi:hypothetical protein CDL15_Pgr024961 [Punica granatum]|uniref:Copper transport protein n=1 Tax=Punica granatum TaxID=22663 RepID=A0A218W7D8_PUNGR|nr:hypothetical protein CDL15_Pgr024961 [Punica granatum]
MDMGGGMGGMAPPHTANATTGAPAPPHHPHKMTTMMHMTFFWGKDGYILFSGWPGTGTGMYVLALFVTFALAVLVEFLTRCRLMMGQGGGLARGVAKTMVHAIRMGLAYLIMLALMSFNGGVFIAAIVGHMVGFLIFGSGAFGKRGELQPPYVKTSDVPTMNC